MNEFEEWDAHFLNCRYFFKMGASVCIIVLDNKTRLQAIRTANYLRGCYGVKRVELQLESDQDISNHVIIVNNN